MFGEVLHTLKDLAATLASVLVCGHTLPHDEGRKRRPDAPRRDLRCISLQILEQISLRHQMTPRPRAGLVRSRARARNYGVAQHLTARLP